MSTASSAEGSRGKKRSSGAQEGQKLGKKSRKERNDDGAMQKALEMCHRLGEALKVDTNEFDMNPFDQTLCRIFAAYARKQRMNTIYSSPRTINLLGGRLLYAAICESAGLSPTFSASGCALWEHQWSDTGVRCFHGDVMLKKENVTDLTPNSEAGANALREGRGLLSTNKWGKQSVRIEQEASVVCSQDGLQKFGNFSRQSCGLLFTDSNKAKTAMGNAIMVTQVAFPGANTEHLLFIPTQCECNYGGKSCLGRQLCRITPFAMPGLDNIQAEDVDAKRVPFVKNPAVFVFQCCNYGGNKRSAVRSCDFKISYCDLLNVLGQARRLWQSVFAESMSLNFPILKWGPEMQVKNATLPEVSVCPDANPFGDIPPRSANRKDARHATVISSGDEEDEEEDEGGEFSDAE